MSSYEPTNRQKTQKAKRGLHWCIRCDMALVGQYGKCPNCGYIELVHKTRG